MALNYTRSAFLGQSPDLLSSQVEDARRIYGNALQLLLKSKGTPDANLKTSLVNQAIKIVDEADATFPDDIKRHPDVQVFIRPLQEIMPLEIKHATVLLRQMREEEAKAATAAEAALAKKVAEDARAKENEKLIEDETKDAGETGKFPVIPLAIAAGAIALALTIGG